MTRRIVRHTVPSLPSHRPVYRLGLHAPRGSGWVTWRHNRVWWFTRDLDGYPCAASVTRLAIGPRRASALLGIGALQFPLSSLLRSLARSVSPFPAWSFPFLPPWREKDSFLSLSIRFLFRIFLISSSNFSLSSCARFSNVSLPAICRSLQFTPSTFRKTRVDGNMRIVNVGI